MKKAGESTRAFRYDLNQILYDYTGEVTNRLKGLYPIDRVPEEPWIGIIGGTDQGHPQEKEMQNGKIVV